MERSTHLTEKELRSLSRHEMLELLLRQEIEIEKLAVEKEEAIKLQEENAEIREKTGATTETSLVMTEIMSAAQNAAELYLENVKATGTERKEISERIERRNRESALASKKILMDTQNVFDRQLERLVAARAELADMVKRVEMP